MQFVAIKEEPQLDNYANAAMLADPVRDLRAEARALVPHLRGRRVLMVNSTATGGGVAEMLPKMVALLCELGVPTRWAVLQTRETDFFALTKRIHNLIHGAGDPTFTEADRQLYEQVNRENAATLRRELRPGDILVVHDPQPMALARFLREDGPEIRTLWRCHIGLDEHLPATRAAWAFLRPYAAAYDRAIFTAPGYIPDFFTGRAAVIFPALDPVSHKNRPLPIHKVAGIAVNAGLAQRHHEVLTPDFDLRARRLGPDGQFGSALAPDCIGILFRPMVVQISRWDRLKGFHPLLQAFLQMKAFSERNKASLPARDSRRFELARLILAGPDPDSIQDDPEGVAVLTELIEEYRRLSPQHQRDVVLLALPMKSRKQNALMVNVLQRCATVVVQNSLQEGFGLTVTEAMWKAIPVLGTARTGIRHQVRDQVDGRLVADATAVGDLADALAGLLSDVSARARMGEAAQRRAAEEFLIFRQLRGWLKELVEAVAHPRGR